MRVDAGQYLHTVPFLFTSRGRKLTDVAVTAKGDPQKLGSADVYISVLPILVRKLLPFLFVLILTTTWIRQHSYLYKYAIHYDFLQVSAFRPSSGVTFNSSAVRPNI
jgi:hypothetical protein